MVCSECHFGGVAASPAARDGRGGRQAAPPGPHIVALSCRGQRQQGKLLSLQAKPKVCYIPICFTYGLYFCFAILIQLDIAPAPHITKCYQRGESMIIGENGTIKTNTQIQFFSKICQKQSHQKCSGYFCDLL